VKITDITIHGVVFPGNSTAVSTADWPHPWAFVVVETDEGINGYGEFTYPRASAAVARLIKGMAGSLIGEDPFATERIWNKLFRYSISIGALGIVTAAASAIDIALWDIKGKATGLPVYALLGGEVRDAIDLYTHPRPGTPTEVAEDCVRLVEEGFTALKTDPFWSETGSRRAVGGIQYLDGFLSPQGENQAISTIREIRNAIGSDIQLMVEMHANFNVPTAIRLIRSLLEYDPTWFEEPCPPESLEALRQVKESVDAPLCVGERLFTRWQVMPVLAARLVDYLMADVVWTGGISELRKIASLAEIWHIPVSPHNAEGALQVLAGAHTMMAVPNFSRLELSSSFLPAYNEVVDPPLDIRNGSLHLSSRPGLGVELNLDYIDHHSDESLA